ncbi:MAG: hypothetical protein ACK5UX_08280 [Burkholderiales bacterium]
MNGKQRALTFVGASLAWLVATSACAQAANAPVASNSAASPTLQKMLGEVSAKRIEANIRKLAGFGTRSTLSETESETRGIGAARRWIKRELEACSKASGGRLNVEFDSFIAPFSPRIAKPS